METATRLEDTPERYHLQRLADELTGHGWQCTLQGNRLTVVNPHELGLTDQVVCRCQSDGWHYTLAHHKTRTLGHVDAVAEIAQQIMNILGPIAAHPEPST